MINISLCDDEREYIEAIRRELSEYQRVASPEPFAVADFSSPSRLVASVEKRASDIYILDILMPGTDGIELGRAIRRMDPDGIIIYLTSSAEFAISSYEVGAFYYLLKPVDGQTLRPVMDRAVDHVLRRRREGLVVRTRSGDVFLPFSQLLYAELDSRAVCYHLADGSQLRGLTLRTPFKTACGALLRDRRFVMCGASWCVNLSMVTAVGCDGVTLRGGSTLSLSKRALGDIHAPWLDYWLED